VAARGLVSADAGQPKTGQPERVGASLNRALHTLLAEDPRVYLIGEDIADPYGGAFKISAGLSTAYPERVLSTPLSEGSFAGLAAGLALCGDRPIVEVMFGDFLTLCFDQILNFASKSVSMYGRRIPVHMVFRVPVGGRRGYGPTHSQHPVKHFLGIPGLAVFELTPFRDCLDILAATLGRGEPCLVFEDKVLYTQPAFAGGVATSLFRYELLDDGALTTRAYIDDAQRPDWVLVAPGGLAHRALDAATRLFIDHEMYCELLVPSRLYPVGLAPLKAAARRARRVCVVEDSTAGATWGGEVARLIHEELWDELDRPVQLISAAASVIPAAPHLERHVLPDAETIYRTLSEGR
jgi:pyruvate/2-oxoglutarate/acetoin dehydrogenase E1 component